MQQVAATDYDVPCNDSGKYWFSLERQADATFLQYCDTSVSNIRTRISSKRKIRPSKSVIQHQDEASMLCVAESLNTWKEETEKL